MDFDKISINDAYKRVKIRQKKDVERERQHKRIADRGFWEAKKDESRLDEEKRQRRKQREEKRRDLALKIIDLGYKTLAMKLHPDKDGTADDMIELQDVKQQIHSYIKRHSGEVLYFK